MSSAVGNNQLVRDIAYKDSLVAGCQFWQIKRPLASRWPGDLGNIQGMRISTDFEQDRTGYAIQASTSTPALPRNDGKLRNTSAWLAVFLFLPTQVGPFHRKIAARVLSGSRNAPGNFIIVSMNRNVEGIRKKRFR